MKRRLVGFPAEGLQHLALLIAFGLLVAARGFVAQHPALAAILVFVFSLPYLVASVSTRRAHFLYGTMLLGATSYFLACYALGAPVSTFPLLSVPIAIWLWMIGQHLRRRLPAALSITYSRTVFRAVNITVAVFTIWALRQTPILIRESGFLQYIAGLAFLGYAGLYLSHRLSGAPVFYTYIFSAFLAAGAILSGAALWSVEYCWLTGLAAAVVMLLVGTKFHRERTYSWSRHFYICAGGLLLVSIGFSVLRWSFFLYNLALTSFVLWSAYGWLAKAVGDVRGATTNERLVAKYFFLGSLVLAIPVAPAVFARPGNLNAAIAGIGFGLIFGWIAWRRSREIVAGRNAPVFFATMFVSAGVIGLGSRLEGPSGSVLALAIPAALLVAIGLFYHRIRRPHDESTRMSLAEAGVFPAFFGWYTALSQHSWAIALAVSLVTLSVSLMLSRRFGNRSFLYAVGPASAGGLISGVLLAGKGSTSWVVYAVAAGLATVCFIWADSQKLRVTRGAVNLVWLIVSVATVVIAVGSGVAQAMLSLVVIAFISVFTAGWRKRQTGRDVFDVFVGAVSVLATLGVLLLAPVSGLGLIKTGLCLLVLSAAYGVAWGLSRAGWYIRTAQALFAFGLLLAIFGWLPAVESRLGAGAMVVAALFVMSVVGRRFPEMAASSVVVGHMTSIVLALATLVQAWPVGRSYLPIAAVPYVLLYALTPRLRERKGFKVGTACWISIVVLFALVAYSDTPYREHVPLVAIISLMWLVFGYGLRNTAGQTWTMPLYITAAVLGAFCGAVSLFAPAAEHSWLVFLVNGMVFASLFVILKQDVFAYLLTLSLSLMAYDWVKASTSRFTQDVLFYLVLGTALLGVFFVLPYLRKLVVRLGSVPMISIFTWHGALIIAVPVAGLAALVLSAYSLKITAHPKFCVSCHYMGGYYESWQHSSHRDVECVKCHYDPGLRSEVEGKVAGMIQLLKYVSHSYGTRPHAMISNEACMREGCHAGMDRSEEMLVFRGKVRFRHDKHLDRRPRGKVLNCVSCHGQIVEGQHITVTERTCLTCHFYGRGDEAVAVGDCQTCHFLPEETVEFMGQPFNHREFLEDKEGVLCVQCHSQVTEGDGVVSRVRCETCHLEPAEDIGDQARFHLVHVSEGHFECVQCHGEIKHGIHPMLEQPLTSGNCKVCHGGTRHSIQEEVYAGTAIADMDSMPDVMYAAGVSCEGCHVQAKFARVGETSLTGTPAGARQCTECHGDEWYGELITEWQTETRERTSQVRLAIERLKTIRKSAMLPDDEAERAQQLLAAAENKISCIVLDGSDGAHNYAYVSAILDEVEAEIEECQTLLAIQRRPSQRESGK